MDVKLWTQQTNGSQWTVQVIKFLWDRFSELWETRNEVVHGTDGKVKTVAKQACLQNTIESMYHLKDQLLASDQKYMFQMTAEMEEFLATKTMRYIHDWIVIWYPFFKRSI